MRSNTVDSEAHVDNFRGRVGTRITRGHSHVSGLNEDDPRRGDGGRQGSDSGGVES
jgi:hypothetical protein